VPLVGFHEAVIWETVIWETVMRMALRLSGFQV
jgi:hypothetical protein